MGNTASTPPDPIDVAVHHAPPRKQPVPGFVVGNRHTLRYTLLPPRRTVGDLLAMMGQHGAPEGNGVVGLRIPGTREALRTDTVLHEGARLELVVTHDL